MGHVTRLKKGDYILDLNVSPYKIEASFNPPSPLIAPLMALGTAANRDGPVKRGDQPLGRTLNFDVIVSGSSEAQCRLAAQPLLSLLNAAGDEDDPLYFEFRGNDNVVSEPLWGQYGSNLRYEIIHASSVRLWSQYSVVTIRERTIIYSISCTIKPYGLGKEQRLCSATGGVLEDIIGSVDGLSRGVQIPEATTNLYTNPMFGHGTAYDTNWVTQANLTSSENKNGLFTAVGSSSAKVVSTGTTNISFYQSLSATVATYELSCYVKLPDAGVVSGTQCVLVYNTTQTTTYTAVGNGWYRLTASFTGSVSALAVGIRVEEGYTIYCDAFQLEQKDYATPFCFGYMMGCAWTGTAHESTTTRTAARLRIPVNDSLSMGEGTIRVVWKADKAHTTSGSNLRIFEENTSMFASWTPGTTDWRFTDGTNTIDGANTTWSAGDILVFHFVYEPGSLVIYLNGASHASGASFDPPTLGTYVYIGSTDTATAHLNGTFMDFSTYETAMSTAETLADYNNITEYISGGDGYGHNLNPIPWLWTLGGDDTVDNDELGSNEAHVMAGGIPGNVAAKMKWVLQPTAPASASVGREYYISLLDLDLNDYFDPLDNTFDSTTGTQAISTTKATVFAITPTRDDVYFGRDFYFVTNFSDAGSNLLMGARVVHGAHPTNFTDTEMVSAGNDLFHVSLPNTPVNMPDLDTVQRNITVSLVLIRTTGSANITRYNGRAMFRPMMRIKSRGDVSDITRIRMENNVATLDDDGILETTGLIAGDTVELLPNRFNMLNNTQGDVDGTSQYNVQTLEYEEVYITPRWLLI